MPTIAERGLFAAVQHYTDLLATPHSNFGRWRRDLLCAKSAVAALARLVERRARLRRWGQQRQQQQVGSQQQRQRRVIH